MGLFVGGVYGVLCILVVDIDIRLQREQMKDREVKGMGIREGMIGQWDCPAKPR